MDLVTNEDMSLILQQSGSLQTPRIKVEVLDSRTQRIVGTIEGLVSGSISIDGESDVRRSGNIVIQPTLTEKIKLEEGNLVWLDKDIRISVGLWNFRTKTYKYYPMGTYIYTDTSSTYDATTNQLTVNISDFMGKLDGTKNGQLGALTILYPVYEGDYDFYAGTPSYSNNVYTATIEGYTEYYDYDLIGLTVTSDNTEGASININGLGNVKIYEGDTYVPITAGKFKGGNTYIIQIERNASDGSWVAFYYDICEGTGKVKVYSIIRNAVIETLERLAGITNYRIDDIGEYKAMPEYNENWQEYRKEFENIWNTIPFDQEFSAGCSVLSILTTFRDLYPNYEMFFDVETNAFICQLKPMCYEDDIFLTNDFIQKVLISEQVTNSMVEVRNVCQVWGQTFENDYYSEEVSYSGNTYSCNIQGFEDTYYTGDVIGLMIPTVNGNNASININNFGAIPIYDEGKEAPINAGVLEANKVYTFKIKKVKVDSGGDSRGYAFRAYLLGQWQVHAINVLTDGTVSNETFTFDGVEYNKYSEEYYKKVYNCERVDFEIIPNSPFTVQKIGEILDVKTGGEYENITSDELAAERARWENWKTSRLTDNISITTAFLPWLDVNKKVTYKPQGSDVEHQYIITNISHDFAGYTSSITMYRFYPLYDMVTEEPSA